MTTPPESVRQDLTALVVRKAQATGEFFTVTKLARIAVDVVLEELDRTDPSKFTAVDPDGFV